MSRSLVTLGLVLGTALVALPACSGGTERQSFDPNGAPGAEVDTDGDGTPDAPAGTSTDGTPSPQPGKVGCVGSAWTEAVPTTASLASLSFTQAKAVDYLLGALALRYPIGKFVMEGGMDNPLSGQPGCVDQFLRDRSSAAKVLAQAGTVVHECGHFLDIGKSKGSTSAYVIRDDLELACKSGDTTSRGGKTFARSLLKTDAYYTKRQACGGQVRQGCDMYADIYLDGNATDARFESGDQGYNTVLEEATQYVNSLATAMAFQDQLTGTRVSERDGILTFFWYIERYLKLAREKYPQAYATLSQDPCWRQATLSVWDRGWFFLNASKGKASLQIDADAIEALVKDPQLTAEIDALRALECK